MSSKKKSAKSKKAKRAKPVSKVPPKRSSKNRSLLLMLGFIIAITGILIYSNTIGHAWALDDYSAIKENYVTKKGVAGFGDIFTKHYRYGYWNSPGELYRPVSLAMFAVEWQLSPDNPGLHHFINILFYALTGFLLFWTLVKLMPKKSPLIPFIVAMIFIVHPLHVEVVANIKSRDEILSFFFCIGAVYCFWKYLRFADLKWIILAAFSYTIAMFSKENAITFLAIFPLIGYFFLKKDFVKSLLPSAVFVVPVLLYLGVRYNIVEVVDKDYSILDNVLVDASNKSEQLATAFMFALKYLKNLFVPHPLGSDFGFPQYTAVGWGNWQALLGFVLYIGMGVYAVLNFKKRSFLVFGILVYLITFSIASNILIMIGTSYGDRLLYVPVLGFAFAVGWAIDHFLIKSEEPSKATNLSTFFSNHTIPLAVLGVIVLAFSIKTIQRNPVWEDSYSLYHADIEVAPNSAKLNYHYGLELNKKGINATDSAEKGKWWDQAMFRFNRAIELYPSYHDGYAQRGLMYYRLKDFPKALADYQTSLKYKPNNSKVYSNMGTIYFETNQRQEAIDAYKKAVQYDPRFVDARKNLGSAYAMNREFNKAIIEYKEALKYAPNDANLHLFLGTVYKDLGDQATSQQWLQKAYQLNPSLRK